MLQMSDSTIKELPLPLNWPHPWKEPSKPEAAPPGMSESRLLSMMNMERTGLPLFYESNKIPITHSTFLFSQPTLH